MKNRETIFLIACLVLCLIPSVGMLFFPTTESTENRAMASSPELWKEDGLNTGFFGDLEKYFNDHMALRNPLLRADAGLQTGLFGVSNVSGVIRGQNGWLYYASTLDDYLGNAVLSERELANLAHNFSVVHTYLEERGIRFVLTIPPNKNTLYGENMPYYDRYIVDTDHNAELLEPFLRKESVPYLDLFRLFREHDEILYRKRDSHWNGKGAWLVYCALTERLGGTHEDYGEPIKVLTRDGDLNRMLYSFYGPKEEDYVYDLPEDYRYSAGDGAEDGWIVTEGNKGEGTLLMFRDSFADTLIPMLSNGYQRAYYSKGAPNAVERYVETYSPDQLVIEKVERNIAEYLNDPPILTPPETDMPTVYTITPTETNAELTPCENDVNYIRLVGTVDLKKAEVGSEILAQVNETVYKVYQTGENGFLMYLKSSDFSGDTAMVRIYIVNEDITYEAFSGELMIPDSERRQ